MDLSIKVSIITVCYNSESTISKTIQSVLNQTYSNIEYIIIDGASTDGTMNIVKQYEKMFGGRMKWISEPDEGIYYAMNKGIEVATGELIGLLNSDDTYENDAVEQIVSSLTIGKYQILYGFARVYSNNKMDSISMISHYFLPSRMINHTACFVSKKIYTDFGYFNTKYISVSDYDFMLKMYGNQEVEFTPVYALISNFHSGGMSSTEKAYMDLLKLRKDYGMISKVKYCYQYVQHLIYLVLHH